MLNLLALQAWVPDLAIQQYWNAPGWSISSEMFFYLCFPVLLRWRRLDGTRRGFLALWLGMALVLALALGCALLLARHASAQELARLGGWLAYTVRCPLLGLYCFATGIHLARAARRQDVPAPGRGAMVLATLLVVAAGWAVTRQKPLHAVGFYVEISAIYLVYTPYFYLLIRYLLGPARPLSRVLARPAMVLLGDASYALYLLHWLPLCLLLSGPPAWRAMPLVAPLTVLGLIGTSVLVYRLFEDPLRRRIRRLAGEGG